MSVKVVNNRFIVSSVVGFYQHLTCRVSSFQELGNYLVREAERAQAFRQTEKLKDLGAMLTGLPLQEYSVIGQYYLAWCEYRNGQNVQHTLERIIEQTRTYKPKALFSLAALVTSNGDIESGARYYLEGLKLSDSPSTLVGAVKGMAVLKSMEGFKKSALKDLENLSPVLKYVNPKTYYDYLNSLAVELKEARRIEEAKRASEIVLASPFLPAYPEWRETGEEIALTGYRQPRSVVSFALKPAPDNVLQLPDRCLSSGQGNYTPSPSPLEHKASIVNLENWKKKMGKKSKNGEDKKLEPLEDMTRQDMAMNILEIITHNSEDEIKLRKLLEYARELYSKPDKADK